MSLQNKPPIASPFPDEKVDVSAQQLRKRKLIRVGLIILAILLVLWITGEIIFYNAMYEMYYKHFSNQGR